MPLRTETFDLDAELEALHEEQVDLGERAEQHEPGTPPWQQLQARTNRKQLYKDGLAWAIETWEDTEITLGALSAGEYAELHRYLPDDPDEERRQNVMVAFATVDAPYVEAEEPIKDTLQRVGNELHPYFVKWAEAQAQNLLRPESGRDNPFYRIVTEAASE